MLKAIHQRLPWPLKPPTEYLYEYYRTWQFERMADRTNGMLSGRVYKELNELAQGVAYGNVLEIGAAHGGTTVAIASALRDAGTDSTVVSFEKGEGGSRVEYGTKAENLRILRENLADHDVDDLVEVVPEHLERGQDLPDVVHEHAPYVLLCIDADGKLDRDFDLLYDLLEPGALIVIDDYSPRRDYTQQSPSHPLGGGKNVRTFYYLNYFLERELVGKLAVHENTFFGYKTVTGDFDDVSEDDVAAVDEVIDRDRERARQSEAA